MEDVRITEFVTVDSGDGAGSGYGSGAGSGYGYGYGDGYGDGYGYGYDDGSGYGYGDGSGYGYGDGYGYGSGIKTFLGKIVNYIDTIPTILDSIHGNIAKGKILNSDLTMTSCYVIKQNNLFAHGKTLREAQEALIDKLFDDMPEEERISEFMNCHKWGVKYSAQDLFNWHHRLTGSCEQGRKAFVKSRGLNMGEYFTVEKFINICKDSYGGGIIKRLKENYSK